MRKKRRRKEKQRRRKKKSFPFFFFFFSVKALYRDANDEYRDAIELIYFIIPLLSIEKIEF